MERELCEFRLNYDFTISGWSVITVLYLNAVEFWGIYVIKNGLSMKSDQSGGSWALSVAGNLAVVAEKTGLAVHANLTICSTVYLLAGSWGSVETDLAWEAISVGFAQVAIGICADVADTSRVREGVTDITGVAELTVCRASAATRKRSFAIVVADWDGQEDKAENDKKAGKRSSHVF